MRHRFGTLLALVLAFGAIALAAEPVISRPAWENTTAGMSARCGVDCDALGRASGLTAVKVCGVSAEGGAERKFVLTGDATK